MNLKDALKEAKEGKGRRIKREIHSDWFKVAYTYDSPSMLVLINNDGHHAEKTLYLSDFFAEDWIVEPLPEPEKNYFVHLSEKNHDSVFCGAGTRSEILAAVKKWAEEA